MGDPDNDGNPNYQINLVLYQDCNSINWFTTGGPYPLPNARVGIYEGQLNQNNMSRSDELFLPLVDTGLVKPNFSDTCKFGISNYCVFETVYSTVVELDATTQGYHFIYDVCCRADPQPLGNGPNNVSVGSGEGSVLHTWVGSSAKKNSSVIFPPITEPYICLGDTSIVNNTAQDLDGNILTFEFYKPYDGSAVGGSSPAPGNFSYPVTNLVNYLNGFNQSVPFGTTGFVFIDPTSGLSLYQSGTNGIYLIGIKVTERDTAGTIVGVSEREFQYIVAPCQNSKPNSASKVIGTSDSLVVQEGDSICFPIGFYDPDGDTLNLSFSGDAFNPFLASSASFSTPTYLDSIIRSSVCWQTTCDLGRDAFYQVVASATDNGCPPRTTFSSHKITVIPFRLPSKIKGDTNVCHGPIYQYNIDSIIAKNFNWQVTNGQFIGNTTSNKVFVKWNNGVLNGALSISPVSEFGCTDGTLNLNVNLKPIAPVEAGTDIILCDGDSAILGGSPSGPLSYIYAWSDGGFLNNDSITNPIAKPDTTVNFVLTGIDTSGCFVTDSVSIGITLDRLTAGPDLYSCPGDSVQLIGSGADIYSWSPSNGLSSNSDGQPLTSPLDTTIYVLTGTFNVSNCVYTDTVMVEVDTIVPTNLVDLKNYCIGDTVDIGGQPTSPQNTTFKWTPNNFLSSDTVSNPLSTVPSDTTYYLQVFNGACFGYDTIDIHVDTIPFLNAGNDTSICAQQFTVMNPTGDNLTNFQWYPDSVFFNDTIAKAIFAVFETQTISLQAYGATGCIARDSVLITQLELPKPKFPSDTLLCFGDTLILDAGPGQTFVWSPNIDILDTSVQIPKFYTLDTTTYTVDILGLNSCLGKDTITVNTGFVFITGSNDTLICPGDTFNLFVTGGASYRWYNSKFIADSTISDPTVFPYSSTSYLVDVTSASGCIKTDTILVEVSNGNFVTAGNNITICYDDTANLDVIGLVNFRWQPNFRITSTTSSTPSVYPLDTLEYYVFGTDSNNCPNADSIIVFVRPEPLTLVRADENICKGDTANIGGITLSGISYLWTPDTSINNSNISNPIASPKVSTPYILKVTNSDGCKSRDTVNINVFTILSTPDTFVCVEDGFTVTAIPRFGNPPYQYNWSPTDGLSDTTIGAPQILNVKPTVYTIIITDSTGCSDTATIEVGVGVKPEANFEYTVVPTCDNAILKLSNKSSNHSAQYWKVGADSSAEENPVFTIPYGEDTKVELVVVSDDRCLDTLITSAQLVTFEDFLQQPMTSVFTPNNDRINDWFEFPLEQRMEQCTELQIYNRWGQLVHQSEDIFHSWDGRTVSGQEAPVGVYFYVLKINALEWKGSVTLLR